MTVNSRTTEWGFQVLNPARDDKTNSVQGPNALKPLRTNLGLNTLTKGSVSKQFQLQNVGQKFVATHVVQSFNVATHLRTCCTDMKQGLVEGIVSLAWHPRSQGKVLLQVPQCTKFSPHYTSHEIQLVWICMVTKWPKFSMSLHVHCFCKTSLLQKTNEPTKVFEKLRSPRWPLFRSNAVHLTSHDISIPFCGYNRNSFGHITYPPSFHCTVVTWRLWAGREQNPPFPRHPNQSQGSRAHDISQ